MNEPSTSATVASDVVVSSEDAARSYPSASRARLRQLHVQWKLITRNNLQKICIAYILALLFVSIFAPWIVPHPESIRGAVDATSSLQAPSWSHPFGTDEFGRDVFSRVVYGARLSVGAGLLTILISVAIGSTVGAIAASLGGWADEVIMRLSDIVRAFPALVLAVVIAAYWGGSLRMAIIALAVAWWPAYARLLRGTAVSVRERPYIRAAQSIGVSRTKITFAHILPGSMGPVIVSASLDVGLAILALASMSFLGVGAQPPTPEWGLMINMSRQYFLGAWWYMAFPGLAITVTVLAFSILGDGLGVVLNPKTRGRG